MIVGYTDESDTFFCSTCWTERSTPPEKRSPSRVLDTDDPDDPGDNFWLVDVCGQCRREIRYKHAQVLD